MKRKIDLLAQTTEKSGSDYLGTIELESFRNKCILNFKGKTQRGKLSKIEISRNPKNGKMCPALNDRVHSVIAISIEEKMNAEKINSSTQNTNCGIASGSIKIDEEEYLIFFENQKPPAKILNQRPRPVLIQQTVSC